jgi:phosphatidylglycerol:prolipoprotein diacylglycerol transferase
VLPFVAIDESKIAPFHPFGVCCALAFFFWDWALMKAALRRGFERTDVRVLTIVLGVFGWGFAWGVDALFYRSGGSAPGSGPGLSSTGAIVGATVASISWCFLRIAKDERTGRWAIRRRERSHPLLALSEVILSTYPMAWAIGRLGCALIHDHVGKSVSPGTLGSLFAVGFPRSAEDGVHRAFGPLHLVTGGTDLRFDLGLLEFLFLVVLGGAFMLTWKRSVRMGTYTMIGALAYGPFRFFLDFLRVEEGITGDARHGGLTFAQYWSLAVIALGVVLLLRRKRLAAPETTPAPEPS